MRQFVILTCLTFPRLGSRLGKYLPETFFPSGRAESAVAGRSEAIRFSGPAGGAKARGRYLRWRFWRGGIGGGRRATFRQGKDLGMRAADAGSRGSGRAVILLKISTAFSIVTGTGRAPACLSWIGGPALTTV
jgi:hypothetical protein